MSTTQYIGARYVPLFADPIEWNKTRTYEPLTIVIHEGNSYTSRQYVPIGIDIDNDDYWALTGNYNAQVEQYRKDVIKIDSLVNGTVVPAVNQNSNDIATNKSDIAANKSDIATENNRALDAEKALSNNLDQLRNATVTVFSCVADMKNATNLIANTVVYCSAFYKNSGIGGGYYNIINNANVNDFDTFECKNNLFATKIVTNYDVSEFGAYCDGVNDDAPACMFVLNKYKNAYSKAPLYTETPIIIAGQNYNFNFYTLISNAEYAFDISGVDINITGTYFKGINGFIFATSEYSQNVTIDINRLFCSNNVLTDGSYNFQSFYYYGNMWQYGNAIAEFGITNTGFIGNQNFFGMNYSMPGFEEKDTEYYNSEKYAFVLNCNNRKFTGFNFYSVSFEQAGNGIKAYGMDNSHSIENLYIYSARTAEFSLNYKRKLLKLVGSHAPLTGRIIIDYAYENIIDVSEFNTESSPAFTIYGKFFYDFSLKTQYSLRSDFVEAQLGYKQLIITKLNSTVPSMNPNTLETARPFDSEKFVFDVSGTDNNYYLKASTKAFIGKPIYITNVQQNSSIIVHILNESNAEIRTITITNGANVYWNCNIVIPTSYNYTYNRFATYNIGHN